MHYKRMLTDQDTMTDDWWDSITLLLRRERYKELPWLTDLSSSWWFSYTLRIVYPYDDPSRWKRYEWWFR
nr:hypothetical protein [Mycoplasmopsis agalactiae]